ncbi:hypothetical protein [Enterobacter asburiae]|uniref:hypothetical protein n=1 Tax=Enterobacter asburiae TaxID=61645 RepID=UPI0034CF600E
MKLIDILVQELPDLGGWPIGADGLYQNAKGHLIGVQGCIISSVDMELGIVAEDLHRSVTREQYEAALAASKPEWDGEGLPPVGCEFLFGTHQTKAKCIAVGRDVIFASTGNPDEKDGFYEEFVISIHHSEFRPIRSEADKKRDESMRQLSHSLRAYGSVTEEQLNRLYNDIEAGFIPHIRID